MKKLIFLSLVACVFAVTAAAQMPKIEPGVSQELAKWRAARYSDVRYKLDLKLEKMSPVLKGTIEVRIKVSPLPKGTSFGEGLDTSGQAQSTIPPIILDWRKIRGHEDKSTISNVSINGRALSPGFSRPSVADEKSLGKEGPPKGGTQNETPNFGESNEHLIFSDGVVAGENVIKLDFTSPILTSGSAITRYIDKEDGSEYLYSLFVPSDASTAFPVFDQPDIKGRFGLKVQYPNDWTVVGNSKSETGAMAACEFSMPCSDTVWFAQTKPISTYVFAFAAGPWERVELQGGNFSGSEGVVLPRQDTGIQNTRPTGKEALRMRLVSPWEIGTSVFVRKSQAEKFKPHAAEVFRLNRESVKFFEEYFDYKFPFPKYDLVLIPEFPFGGMEHAGATFLRESAIIFPQEPTKNDHISRAILIFHEAAHQWFGDTVTMKWFDDLWLKEGFANFAAYKALEKIMPEANAWKVFYERIKQGAYATDSTKGTTAIYQPIANLSAAKSAYGNIVYNKAPAFLRQAEFYLGEEKFQTAVRSFLKKHEYKNATWEDLVTEFETSSKRELRRWGEVWVKQRGLPRIRSSIAEESNGIADGFSLSQVNLLNETGIWELSFRVLQSYEGGETEAQNASFSRIPRYVPGKEPIDDGTPTSSGFSTYQFGGKRVPTLVFPNYQDYGYGIFLLDAKSREYVLKNIQNEKDPFLRSMMWGALWDSVREGELDPREYVELVVKVLSTGLSRPSVAAETSRGNAGPPKGGTQNEGAAQNEDESTTALLLNRVGTAMNYYMPVERGPVIASDPNGKQRVTSYGVVPLQERLESLLNERMRNAPTTGQRITYYRAFLNVASSETALRELRKLLFVQSTIRPEIGLHRSGLETIIPPRQPAKLKFGTPEAPFELKTKDKFDIITKMISAGYSQGEHLLSQLEKLETSDDAKRYAYAARAAIRTKENKAKYWNDFVNNKDISESWIEAAFGPWNSIRHSELTLPYLERALKELPNHKRNRKIFFVNGWLGAFIGGQRSEEALAIVNKFLADNPSLDNDLRLKILENADVIERAVKIRK